MAYGTIKIDTITFTDGGIDKSVSISGLVQNPTFTGNITVTGTVSGNTVRGQTISGVTITGTTAQFTSGTFVSLTGTTLQGTTATYTTGSFTSLTGTTTSGTIANFVSGVFSTQISGVTVTGTTANFTSGNFTNISGGTHTITSGVFASGTAANPSISFVSDPNTGIYSPGADQVAISTNGAQRLLIDSSGNINIDSDTLYVDASNNRVGVKTNSPIGDFHVNGTTITFRGGDGTSARTLELGANATGGGTAISNIRLATYGGNYGILIRGEADYNNNFGSNLQFATSTTGGTVTERARIDSSGRLLVGVSSASTTSTTVFQGNSGGTTSHAIANLQRGATNPGTNLSLGFVQFADSAGSVGAQVYAQTESAWSSGSYPARLIFSTTASASSTPTERMRLDSSGRLGLGTSSPSYTLDIAGTNARLKNTSGSAEFVLSRSANTAGATISLNTGDTNKWFFGLRGLVDDKLHFYNNVAGNTALVIDESSRVGIGTNAPSYKLEIENSADADLFQIKSTASANNTLLRFGISGNDAVIKGSGGSVGNLAFHTFGSERGRFDTSGRFLVGTSTAQGDGRIQIQGSNATGKLTMWRDNAPFGFIDGTAGASVEFGASPSSGVFGIGATISFAGDGTWGSGDYPGRLVFSTTADGASSPTARATIDSSGRLLVGTASAIGTMGSSAGNITPQQQLAGSTFATASAAIIRTAGGSAQLFMATGSPGNNEGSNNRLGGVYFNAYHTDGYYQAASIEGFTDTPTVGAGDMPGRLVFSTTADGASSPTERMRIRNNGELWIHSSGGDPQFLITSSTGAGTSIRLISGRYSGGTIGTGTESFRVFTNGNVENTNNSYGAISDAKLKENIVDANSQWNDLKALQVRNYNFKEGQTHTQIGLIAQEVEIVSPGLVSESPDRDTDGNDLGTVTKSINYSVLYMKAVKALQEAMERIETLEAKVAALEGV